MIEFSVKSYGNFKLNLDYYYFEEKGQMYKAITISLDRNVKDIYNLLIQTIKEKKSLLNVEDMCEQVTVTLSNENYPKILLNKKLNS